MAKGPYLAAYIFSFVVTLGPVILLALHWEKEDKKLREILAAQEPPQRYELSPAEVRSRWIKAGLLFGAGLLAGAFFYPG